MNKLKKRLLWVVKNIEELISGTTLTVMVVITTINVFCRSLLRSPIQWAEELAIICLVWSTFTGAAVCYKRRAHLGIDFVIDRFPYRIRRVMRQILCLVLLLFFCFMTVLSLIFALRAEKTTAYFHLNYAFLYISVTIGFLSMSIYSVIFLIMSFVRPKEYDKQFVDILDAGGSETNE